MKNTLGSLLLAALLLPACMVHGSGSAHVSGPVAVIEVEEAPPPPPSHAVVVVEQRPGFVWVEGRYHRRGNRWDWHNGHWERQRSGHVWVQGRWERRNNRHVWVDGRWQGQGRVDHRDHRDHRREDRPVVRDHRR
jgi:WXXGXW repeat (2 copies)